MSNGYSQHTYGVTPGGMPTGQQSSGHVTGVARAYAPGTTWWDPNAAPIDPHDDAYEPATGEPPSTGPTPDNISVGAIGGDVDISDFAPDEMGPGAVPDNIITRGSDSDDDDCDDGDGDDGHPDDCDCDDEDRSARMVNQARGFYPPGPFSRSKQ